MDTTAPATRRPWALAPVTIVLLVLATPLPAAGQDPSLDQLCDLLEARDAGLKSAILPFASTSRDFHGRSVSRFSGVWAMQMDKEAARYEWIDMRGGTDRPFGTHHATWDGRVGKHLSIVTETQKPHRVRIAPGRPEVLVGWLPNMIGLKHVAKWSAWIRSLRQVAKAVTVEGRDQIAGRGCVRIVVRKSESSAFVIWVDVDDSLLVWKHGDYDRTARLPDTLKQAEDKLTPVTIDGTPWLPTAVVELFEAGRVGGHWIPVRGRVTSWTPSGLSGVNDVTVDASQASVNEPVPAALMDIDEASLGDVAVDNRILDEVVLKPSDSELAPGEKELEAALAAVAAADGLKLGRKPPHPQPVLEASCGLRALYAMLRLSGSTASLRNIESAAGRDKANAWSLDDLNRACAAMGMRARAVRAESPDVLQGWFVAHLRSADGRGTHGNEREHFALARVDTTGVRTLATPGSLASVPLEVFKAQWTGHALVLGDLPPPTQAQGDGSNWVRTAAILSAVCALVLLLVPLLRRRANTAMKAVALLVLTTGMSCSRPPPPAAVEASSGLVLEGRTTIDVGEVPEGVPIDLQIALRNLGETSCAVAVTSSCGVSMQWDKSPLVPGAAREIGIRISTDGRSGAINEFVEAKADPRGGGTVWVVGRVNPTVRLQPAPHRIELGSLEVGDEVSIPLTVRGRTFQAGTAWDPVVIDADPKLCVAWSCSWDSIAPAPSEGTESQLRSGKLAIRGLRQGDIRQGMLTIRARLANGVLASSFVIPVTGRVIGRFNVEPELLLFDRRADQGRLKAALRVTGARHAPSGQPEVCGLPSWLVTTGCAKLDAGYEVVVRLADTVPPGYLSGSFEVRWGDAEPRRVRVVAR